jgi:signal transduction histidine kinase/DNA-binding NarL/FixJ family response regulator
MIKFKIEIQITILAIVISAIVVTAGYFAYNSLSKIVDSVHRETLPDNKLFLIKDIATELTTVEHTLRLYILTNNEEDFFQYQFLQRHIILNLKTLNVYRGKYSSPQTALIDSTGKLAMEKLELWQEILNMHFSSQNSSPPLSEIYLTLDKKKVDAVSTENERIGLLHEIFYPARFIADASHLKRTPEKTEIKQKLKKAELEIAKKGIQKNIIESQLVEKNIRIGKKINKLIAEAEAKETANLLAKTNEANRLAAITYKWLALFTFTAISLLFVALFVLFDYLKKTRIYQSALNKARNKAEKLALAKEKFAANVSHELRTPINAIYGLTEQALQKPLEPETAEMVSVIYKSARHLRNIINDTLDFSKIQANKITFESVNFSPSGVFEDVIAFHKYEAAKKGISLNFNWEGERTLALVGDPLRLKQILINLIGNAIKFTEKGEVTLNIKAIKNGNRFDLNMQVADTGIGMSDENLNIIFDEFVQVEQQSGKKYSGTGLGLPIVKNLVELLGGTIAIESSPGKGTKINVSINYAEGDENNIQKNDLEAFPIPVHFKKLSVLIADDEEFNRYLLKGILEKWGTKIVEAKDGNEAIKAIVDNKFDVVLMDLQMPGVNGIEAAKTILGKCPGTVIIAVSASNEPAVQQNCMNAGMKGFLLKPFSEKELLNTIVSLLPSEKDKTPTNFAQQINMAELLRLANGDKKFLREMILLFIKSSESGIENIEKAIRDENLTSVSENAHKMAAPGKHIGAANLYGNIKKLEKMAQENAETESIFEVFQNIKNEISELNAFLKSQLNEID